MERRGKVLVPILLTKKYEYKANLLCKKKIVPSKYKGPYTPAKGPCTLDSERTGSASSCDLQ